VRRKGAWIRGSASALFVVFLLTSCDGGGSGSSAPASSLPAGTAPSVSSPGPEESSTPLKASDFDPADFEPAAAIDNEWFPLTPGTQFIYEGSSLDDGDRLTHRVVFSVSDMTKEVAGVQVVVIWDRDYTEGELVEAEIAFFAQDRDGNVWHLGQYPEEYEGGKLVKSPGWVAGEEGAKAGIAMKATPELGTPSYAQGYAPPPINWIDRGRTYQMGVETCVPVDCYEDVLVIEEFERTKPGAFQLKYYAPGVGNVRVGWRGKNEEEREELELVGYRQLNPTQMQRAREAVLALDENALRRIPAFESTTPAEVA
jgi:hypothetical protein